MPSVNYLWDPIEDNVIAEFDEDGGLIVEYTTEPELHGDVISQRRDGETNCFYSDGLGSTTEVTNAAGDTIATRAYSAFGETTESTGSVVFPFQYIGQKGYYFDSDIGELYVRLRSYRPSIARWLSVDSWVQQHLRAYMYARNAPNDFIDPSGALEIFFGRATHAFCGGYSAIVRYWPRPTLPVSYPLILVQKVSIHEQIEYCDCPTAKDINNCSRTICEDTFAPIVVYELIKVFSGKKGGRLEDVAAIFDRISLPAKSIPGKCPNTRGTTQFRHEIRLLEEEKTGVIQAELNGVIQAEVNSWRSGYSVDGYKFQTFPVSTSFSYWETGKTIDKGVLEGFMSWDCCTPNRTQLFWLAQVERPVIGNYSDMTTFYSTNALVYSQIGVGQGMGLTTASITQRKGRCDWVKLGDPPEPK